MTIELQMKINRIDHINIRTGDMSASIEFYSKVLGFRPRNDHGIRSAEVSQWLYDHNDQPIIHLYADSDYPPDRRWPIPLFKTGAGEPVANTTGAVHHIALNCTGLPAMQKHLQECGVEYAVNAVESLNITQIFIRDPHGIAIELTFNEH